MPAPDQHPQADKLKPPTWDAPGECICGKPLPPQKDWDRAGMDWANVLCGSCGRGYVDEEDYFAIYDLDDVARNGGADDWKVHSCPGCGHTQHQGWCDCGCLDDRVDIARAMAPCGPCAGTGEYPPTGGDQCSYCSGMGEVPVGSVSAPSDANDAPASRALRPAPITPSATHSDETEQHAPP